ncbi:hypothetical protein [Ferrimicrobium acidiphilum]|uniref:hypothetical protein n=1 Tax=Ferrimicrobium acidiphilum TaxID=121039 RepID=UPI0023EF8331|nr:hypothetical protein [Ferrimicrobium acidiphilum]
MVYISERSLIAAALLTGRLNNWNSEFADDDFRQWSVELVATAETYDAADVDPIMQAIEDARTRRDQAEQSLKILIAYARTCDRPYSLREIAERAKLSPSTVAEYSDEDREHLAKAIAAEAKRLVRAGD